MLKEWHKNTPARAQTARILATVCYCSLLQIPSYYIRSLYQFADMSLTGTHSVEGFQQEPAYNAIISSGYLLSPAVKFRWLDIVQPAKYRNKAGRHCAGIRRWFLAFLMKKVKNKRWCYRKIYLAHSSYEIIIHFLMPNLYFYRFSHPIFRNPVHSGLIFEYVKGSICKLLCQSSHVIPIFFNFQIFTPVEQRCMINNLKKKKLYILP